MTYVRPAPNTDPNNFGTVDRTLDPSMNVATLQSNINAAGTGGVVEWAGSTHYLINTSLVFKTGQKHYTNNGRIIKYTANSHLDAIVNLKTTNATDVTISDLEFWGNANVPARPTANAARRCLVPWRNAFLRRVKLKGGEETGLGLNGDNDESLNILMDTCEIAYNVFSATNGEEAGWKMTSLGLCGTPAGDVLRIWNTEVHHNWAHGLWWDVGCSGVELLANYCHDNARCGIFWEVGAGPVYMRDNICQDNGGSGDIPPNGGNTDGICVISAESGDIINNTLGNNGGVGIRFTQDTSPASRTSLRCPQQAQAGQHQGYFFEDWFVHGNVLNGDGVSSEVTSNPAIDYSLTVVPDDFLPLNQATETDTVQPMTPVMGHVYPTLNQVLETDETLAPSSLKTLAVTQVTEADSTQPITVGQSILGPLNLVAETEQALPVSGYKTYQLNQIWEVDTPLALENTGSSVVDVQHVGSGFTNNQTYRKTLRTGQVVK